MTPDVPRETSAPAPPESAAAVFGAALPQLVHYADLLAGPGVARGLIGPREVPRLWDRHLLNCGVVAQAVPRGSRVDDVGSGAGLPGIVLALARPDLTVTLVEPLLRRTRFLEEAVVALDLTDRVAVLRARTEERARAGPEVDVVTARAVAPLERLIGWTLPLLRAGGLLLALKGANAEAEVAAADSVLRRWGSPEVRVRVLGAGLVDPPTTVVQVRRPGPRDGRR